MSRGPHYRPSILLVNWRDTRHPEGGGSERYVERIAEGLARLGYRVSIQCAGHDRAPSGDWVAGVRFRRRGNKFTVYLHALLAILRSDADVIVDVQNGMPFFSRLVARCPVLVLVHHVHREQWHSALGPFFGRIGWWVESWLAPRLYRKCRYVTVSNVTRDELGQLGVELRRTAVVPNGHDAPPAVTTRRTQAPVLVAVSRLVPHKRLEHAIDLVAELRPQWPDLRLELVGEGPWKDVLRQHAIDRGVQDSVVIHGWVDEQTKHEILAGAWVHLCPSVKEGWGIVIMEAAAHGVPTIAYRSAGGVAEAIVDHETGLLADDFDEFVRHTDTLLRDLPLRKEMGEAGMLRSQQFSWEESLGAFETVLHGALSASAAPRDR